VLLHGYQSYPTDVRDTNLNRIKLFKEIFNKDCRYGYQDHIAGNDEMNFIIPFVSLSLDLDFLEKHVTLDRSKKGVDYYSSLEPKELKDFINKAKIIKSSFGHHLFTFSPQEKKYRNDIKKIWYVKNNIEKTKKVDIKNLIMKRPPNKNISPIFVEELINFDLIKKIKHNDALTSVQTKKSITAVITSRLKSKRLPNKALKKINNDTLIEHLIKRLKQSKKITNIILATTKNRQDLKICKIASNQDIKVFRGDDKNVLKRIFDASKKVRTDIVIRVTGDDILIDPEYLDKLINFHLKKNLEYSNNKNLPGGTEVEIYNKSLLSFLLKMIKNKDDTEYLTFFIDRFKDQFSCGSLNVPKKHRSNQSLTIDTEYDFKFVKNFLFKMREKNKKYNYKMDDVIKYLKKNKKKNINLSSKKLNKINTDFKWEKILN